MGSADGSGGQHTVTVARRRLTAGVLLLAAALAGCGKVPGVYTVEKKSSTHQGTGGGANGRFDAKSYVDKIWSAKLLPTATAKAVTASTVLAAVRADPAKAGKRYGRQAGTGSPYSFLVKGSGRVQSVTSGSTGSAELDLDPADGKVDLSVALGPVFLGTAVRDAVGFIDFSQFSNQIDYADVATAINSKVRSDVVSKVTVKKGARVSFVGAFQPLDLAHVVVTPVQLEVVP
ncbi:MAG: DUF2291 domain-containing protein [Frankiaceae bacterium]